MLVRKRAQGIPLVFSGFVKIKGMSDIKFRTLFFYIVLRIMENYEPNFLE